MKLTEVVKVLRIWSTEIELRAGELRRCGKMWSFLNYFFKGSSMIFAAVATVLITLTATEASTKGEFTPLSIAAICINALAVLLAAIDSALDAAKKASLCTQCSKRYVELSNEITLEIDTISISLQSVDLDNTSDAENAEISFNAGSYKGKDILGEYKFIKAKYMAKEQSVFNEEPFSPWFRSKYITKQAILATEAVDKLDENALIALRARTLKASQWKIRRKPVETEIQI